VRFTPKAAGFRPPGNGAFLIDGSWQQGTWQLRDGELRLRAYGKGDLDPLLAEAAALSWWLAPGAAVVVLP
jgi:hypothetical protein